MSLMLLEDCIILFFCWVVGTITFWRWNLPILFTSRQIRPPAKKGWGELEIHHLGEGVFWIKFWDWTHEKITHVNLHNGEIVNYLDNKGNKMEESISIDLLIQRVEESSNITLKIN